MDVSKSMLWTPELEDEEQLNRLYAALSQPDTMFEFDDPTLPLSPPPPSQEESISTPPPAIDFNPSATWPTTASTSQPPDVEVINELFRQEKYSHGFTTYQDFIRDCEPYYVSAEGQGSTMSAAAMEVNWLQDYLAPPAEHQTMSEAPAAEHQIISTPPPVFDVNPSQDFIRDCEPYFNVSAEGQGSTMSAAAMEVNWLQDYLAPPAERQTMSIQDYEAPAAEHQTISIQDYMPPQHQIIYIEDDDEMPSPATDCNRASTSYKFKPTDAELIGYLRQEYCNRVATGNQFIRYQDIYAYEPHQLRDLADERGDGKMYFFTMVTKSGKNYTDRGIKWGGNWKVTQTHKPIRDESGQIIGYKRPLKYWQGKIHTSWAMIEYTLDANSSHKEELVVAVIYEINRKRKQYKTVKEGSEAKKDLGKDAKG